jgi:hypothetical protein
VVALCLLLEAYALAPNLILAAATLTLVGAAYIGVLSGLSTVVQLQAPEAYRGRILSLFFVALGVTYPIGALIQGPLADWIGLAPTTTAAAGLLLAGLVAVAVLRPTVLDALGANGPAGVSPEAQAGVSPEAQAGLSPEAQAGLSPDARLSDPPHAPASPT